MLGPIGSEIMSIFRLLSPEEIEKYIQRKKSRKVEGAKVVGGQAMSFDDSPPHSPDQETSKKFPKNHQAEIIPISQLKEKSSGEEEFQEEETAEFANIHENNQDEAQAQIARAQQTASKLESIGILSAATIKEQEAKRLKEEKSKQDSTTVFLLKERQKMRESKKKLVGQKAIKSYQVQSAQEFYEESDDDLLEDDLQNNDLKGILLNKRHY